MSINTKGLVLTGTLGFLIGGCRHPAPSNSDEMVADQVIQALLDPGSLPAARGAHLVGAVALGEGVRGDAVRVALQVPALSRQPARGAPGHRLPGAVRRAPQPFVHGLSFARQLRCLDAAHVL